MKKALAGLKSLRNKENVLALSNTLNKYDKCQAWVCHLDQIDRKTYRKFIRLYQVHLPSITIRYLSIGLVIMNIRN